MIITETLSAEHRRCDDLFASAESLVNNADWDQGGVDFANFRARTERHFAQEEDVLFAEFEAATGQTMGPTQVMRSEHMQMRQLLSDMAAALEQQSRQEYLGLSETLMMIMQQHNVKEEQMLYPMADQALAGDGDQVLQRMEQAVPGT